MRVDRAIDNCRSGSQRPRRETGDLTGAATDPQHFANVMRCGRRSGRVRTRAPTSSLGLLLNSPAVIIGAMLVAPLMSAIVGLGLGVVEGDSHLLVAAAWATFRGMILAILIGVFLGLVIPDASATPEIIGWYATQCARSRRGVGLGRGGRLRAVPQKCLSRAGRGGHRRGPGAAVDYCRDRGGPGSRRHRRGRAPTLLTNLIAIWHTTAAIDDAKPAWIKRHRATRHIPPERSTPTAVPEGLAERARTSKACPVPEPISSTRSPDRTLSLSGPSSQYFRSDAPASRSYQRLNRS